MADAKIADLTAASALDGTELHYVVQGGADRKATGSQIKTYAGSAPAGTNGQLQYNVSGSFGGAPWTFSTGNLLADTDGTYDIGASGASRPRNMYLSGGLTASGISNTNFLIAKDSSNETARLGLGQFGLASGVFVGWTNDAGSADSGGIDLRLTRVAPGLLKLAGATSGTGAVLAITALTVATLPSASTAGAGARAFVTDATATTFLSIVAGGGANGVPVVSNSTNWLIG